MREERIDAIDGLRGLAALFVALLHYQEWFVGERNIHWVHLCPDLFFILSGYILTMKYESALHSKTISSTKFVINRISRLWPLHAFALALFLAEEYIYWIQYKRFHVLSSSDDVSSFFYNLAMIQNWGIVVIPTWNKPSWSISTEFAVNLLWMLAIVRLRWTAAIASAVVVISAAALASRSASLNLVVMQSWWGAITPGLLRTTLGFALGCLVFWGRQRSFQVKYPGWIAAASAGLTILGLVFYNSISAFGADYVFVLLLFPALTYFAADPQLTYSRILSCWPMRWLGRISYSVYLLHLPLANAMALSIVWGWGYPSVPMRGFIWMALVLGLSTLTYRWIEQPGIRLTRMGFKRIETMASAWLPWGTRPALAQPPKPS